jgi:WD40 repeat protein
MAPEQMAGASPSAAMDIYSLGVILYELLTSRLPLQGATSVETLDLVRHHEPPSPRRSHADLPRDLETICLKCLEKQPGRRYASALDLADDLRRFQDDLPIQARPIRDWERLRRWCRRNPGLAASSAGVATVFVIAFLLVTLSYLRAEQALQEKAFQTLEAERREKSERWERYRANLGAAASALQLHNTGAALQTLDAAPFEYRNWEWNHFYSRLDASRYLLGSLETKATRGVISRNGSRILMVKQGAESTASIWDVDRLREIVCYSQPHALGGAVLSPDGRTILYAEGNALVLRDVDTDRVRARLPGHDKPVYTTRFTSDSARLITCTTDNRLCTWDIKTGKLLSSTRFMGTLIDGLAASDNGRLAAFTASGQDDPYLMDLQTGKMLPRLMGHQHRVGTIAFNHQGDRVMTLGSYPDLTTRLWDTSTGKLLATDRPHTNEILGVAFSPDRSRLATCSRDQSICLRDGLTGLLVAPQLKGHNGWVNCVAFSPDSKRLVSCSQDRTVRLWDAVTGESRAILHGHTGDVFSVAFTEDGAKIVSSASDGTVRIWDAQIVERDGVLRGHSSFVYHVAVHRDGRRVASASWDGTVRLWDMNTGSQLACFDHGSGCIVSATAFHPDGKVLATRGRDAVHFWDLEKGQELFRFQAPTDNWRDTRLAFSPDGKLLVSGCANREIRVWDVNLRKEVALLRGHEDQIRDVVFSPDGQTLASAGAKEDRTVRLWDAQTHALLRTLRGHQDGVYALAYHPNGRVLASAGLDGTIRFWDCASGLELADPIRLGSNAYGIAFTPDGSRIVGACADNAIRFWDAATRQEVAELRGHDAYVHSIAFSSDGERLASASGDGTVRIWDTLSSRERNALKK